MKNNEIRGRLWKYLWLQGITFSFLAAMVIRGVLILPIGITSAELSPFLPGDLVLINKMAYGLMVKGVPWGLQSPKRGDFTAVKVGANERSDGETVLGRVLALPGDRVEVQGTKINVNSDATNTATALIIPPLHYLIGTPEFRPFSSSDGGPRAEFVLSDVSAQTFLASGEQIVGKLIGVLLYSQESDTLEGQDGRGAWRKKQFFFGFP